MRLRPIALISQREIKYLILSPIGWIILLIFWLFSLTQFFSLFEAFFVRSLLGWEVGSLSGRLLTSRSSVLQEIILQINLIVPLITMATFSRELHSGSIKLLMSSPVTPAEIVLGKFTGVAIYLLGFVAVIIALVAIGLSTIQDFDWAAAVPGILGIYLLTLTYTSIGIFLSSLTRYQIVAAIFTLAVLFVFRSLYGWMQATPVFNEIFYWASMSGRAEAMRSGLIPTSNVTYFLIIIALFLLLTTFRLKRLRHVRFSKAMLIQAAGFVALAGLCAWVTSLPQFSAFVDLTHDRRNSLSPESEAIMSNIQGDIEIVTYANIIDSSGWISEPQFQIQDRERFQLYRQINPDISIRYERFYDFEAANDVFVREDDGQSDSEIIRPWAKRIGVDPDSIQSAEEFQRSSSVDLDAEGRNTFRIINWNGASSVLRHFDDRRRFSDEHSRAPALKLLGQDPVRVGVLSVNGERSVLQNSSRDYELSFTRKRNRASLINDGFTFDEIDPTEALSEFDILVIADPKTEYGPDAISGINSFLSNGGNAIVLAEPDSSESIDDVLENLGLSRGRPLTQDHKDGRFAPSFVFGSLIEGSVDGYWGAYNVPVALDNAVELSSPSDTGPFRSFPFIEAKGLSQTGSAGQSSGANSAFAGIALEREIADRTQRILVFGDADVFSNANARRDEPVTATSLHTEAFYWLTEGEFPVKITSIEAEDTKFSVTETTVDVFWWIFVLAIPLIIAAIGSAVLIKRRRQ